MFTLRYGPSGVGQMEFGGTAKLHPTLFTGKCQASGSVSPGQDNHVIGRRMEQIGDGLLHVRPRHGGEVERVERVSRGFFGVPHPVETDVVRRPAQLEMAVQFGVLARVGAVRVVACRCTGEPDDLVGDQISGHFVALEHVTSFGSVSPRGMPCRHQHRRHRVA